MTKQSFCFDDIPDLSGKVAIVTGGNTGIGFVTVRELARKNCHVFLGSRSKEKADIAIQKIKEVIPNANVEFLGMDLLSLESVDAAVHDFKAKGLPLHILINNAGIMACPFSLSKDGIESQFATNHVAHFRLTTGLLPILEASRPSRIVNVSSMAHKWADSFDLNELNNEKKYSKWTAYGVSKLSNIYFTRELSRRLEEKGVNDLYVNCVHPGVVNTELTRHNSFFGLTKFFASLFFISPDQGAMTQLYVATNQDIERNNYKGQYFVKNLNLNN
ncbi:NAD(P)-binding protein [Rozella allomycis CSF55]|uniref:NAD(P)-binding protein n=1 Tax=Rozella allomycis (strain CSF55) TaxID=988480 RepID=A0A075B3N3_ROZAC|nr:Short-chain dehydrogenase/reductase SDR domain-containing protein [Rozella allomycis CSF55]RKP22075.1 NAD(P)-binding protein [Rozella allomycis CSF55]|eukprot:EPZ37027.1 Short-chain dehydrogenase/reductase SDR domain-containing protein [Rozella allomycis CSF55]